MLFIDIAGITTRILTNKHLQNVVTDLPVAEVVADELIIDLLFNKTRLVLLTSAVVHWSVCSLHPGHISPDL